MSEKNIGYILLVVGILMILGAGLNVYLVFKNQLKPTQLFHTSGLQLNLSQLLGSALPVNVNGPVNANTSSQILSPELINDSSNLLFHFMLMGFIASIGAKIANIGVMLLRPIEVKLKAKEVTVENPK